MKNTYLMTFSPTGTSRKVGQAILKGIGSDGNIIDLTHIPDGQYSFQPGSVVIVTVPVYAGHVAPEALKRMTNISASGAYAVAVVIYGNRAYGSALCELGEMLVCRGFRVIAGGAFVGEHSYSTAEYPIASGRPDMGDLRQAEEFGRSVRCKVESGSPAEVVLKKLPHPSSGFMSKLRFIAGVLRIRNSKTPRQAAPHADESLCIHCGLCTKACPTNAIAKGDECKTDYGKCIRCCACVKGCPHSARSFNTPFAPLLSCNFSRQKPNVTLL